MKINVDKLTEKLETLLNISSPTGDTKEAIEYVEGEFKALGLNTYLTQKGALVATIEGKNTDQEVTLSGHVDTLGAMVKEIKANGRLKLTQLGGYVWDTVEGTYVTIKNSEGKRFTGTILTTKASSHVHGSGTKEVDRNDANLEVRIDEIVESADDVREKLGIEVGDFVYLDPRCQVTESGYIKSRHLDDKAGVISILGMAEYLVENNIKPNYTTNFFISNYEEVGHGASAGIPEKTMEFIAVDMAAPGEGQTSHEQKVTICAKDSTGPYDLELKTRLVNLAKENNIDYVVDIYPFYGSDASAALRAGGMFKAGLIGPGVDASHSFERTHKDAIENTVKLGVAYLTK